MYYSFPEQNINDDLNNDANLDRRTSSDHHHHHHSDYCTDMPHMMEPMHTCPYMHMCHMMQNPMMQSPMMQMPMDCEKVSDKKSCSDDDIMSRQYHDYHNQRPYHHPYYQHHPYRPYHPYYPFYPFFPFYPPHQGYTQRPYQHMGRDDAQESE